MKIFLQSFVYAYRGLCYVFRHEFNFRVQVAVSALVIIASLFLQIRRSEVIVIVFLIGLVLLLEILNSVQEKISDLLKPRLSGQVEVVKNMMAAMVFLASILAIIIGGIIFTPYIIELFGRKW